jgi:hypothetical protein
MQTWEYLSFASVQGKVVKTAGKDPNNNFWTTAAMKDGNSFLYFLKTT